MTLLVRHAVPTILVAAMLIVAGCSGVKDRRCKEAKWAAREAWAEALNAVDNEFLVAPSWLREPFVKARDTSYLNPTSAWDSARDARRDLKWTCDPEPLLGCKRIGCDVIDSESGEVGRGTNFDKKEGRIRVSDVEYEYMQFHWAACRFDEGMLASELAWKRCKHQAH